MTRLAKHGGRGGRSVLSRVVGRCILGLVLFSAAVDYFTFDSFSIPSQVQIRQVSAAVVFTGRYVRVDAGLQLVNAGVVPRLYISGVNGRAGIRPASFVKQFSARNPDIPDLKRLVECCIEWGERADNTIQNAQDTKCWVDRRRLAGSLLLITSQRHMARAMAALSGTIPDRVIIPYPVDDGPLLVGSMRRRAYLNYLITLAVVHLPRTVGGRRIYGPFAGTCPDTL